MLGPLTGIHVIQHI